jgi:hypothetical protein
MGERSSLGSGFWVDMSSPTARQEQGVKSKQQGAEGRELSRWRMAVEAKATTHVMGVSPGWPVRNIIWLILTTVEMESQERPFRMRNRLQILK